MAKIGVRGVFEAAGGIVWREGESGPELAVIYRPGRDDWALPKGHLKKDETYQQAALREVTEETGCQVVMEEYAGCTTYLVQGTPKVVLFWNMRLQGESAFRPNKEVDQVAWLSVTEALKRLVYESERRLVREAAAALCHILG
jgi:ADP-ribose pyrophosphatase YjhB (NUDIX family)